MWKLLILLFVFMHCVFTDEDERFESVKRSGNYLIHRREQKSSGGSVATLSGRGPPPLHIFPIPGIFWSPLAVTNKNNSISTFSSGSAF